MIANDVCIGCTFEVANSELASSSRFAEKKKDKNIILCIFKMYFFFLFLFFLLRSYLAFPLGRVENWWPYWVKSDLKVPRVKSVYHSVFF